MDPKQVLPLLILAHLAGIARGHSVGHAVGRQSALPNNGMAPAPRPQPQPQQKPAAPKQNPKAQGGKGKGQGFHGAKAPIAGGLASRQNALGMLPHQNVMAQNPMLMALQAFGKPQ